MRRLDENTIIISAKFFLSDLGDGVVVDGEETVGRMWKRRVIKRAQGWEMYGQPGGWGDFGQDAGAGRDCASDLFADREDCADDFFAYRENGTEDLDFFADWEDGAENLHFSADREDDSDV